MVDKTSSGRDKIAMLQAPSETDMILHRSHDGANFLVVDNVHSTMSSLSYTELRDETSMSISTQKHQHQCINENDGIDS